MATDGFDDDTLTEDEIDSMIGMTELEEQDSYYQIKEKLDTAFDKQLNDIVKVRIKLDMLINKLQEDAEAFAKENEVDIEDVRLIISEYKGSYGSV